MLNEHTTLPPERQAMLVGILDLENATVEDIMVPRAGIVGIDLDDETATIREAIESAQHTRLPASTSTRSSASCICGAARFGGREALTKADLMRETEEPYFVPASTPLHTQIYNFQKQKRRVALVVDE